MKNTDCENVILAAMARFDGDAGATDSERINAHLKSCENCRLEIAQFESSIGLLKKQARREHPADFWFEIEKRLPQKTVETLTTWQSFVFLGAFLVGYKLLEIIPDADSGWLFKLVPLVFVFALFALIRENPFKINTRLTLER